MDSEKKYYFKIVNVVSEKPFRLTKKQDPRYAAERGEIEKMRRVKEQN